MRLLIYCLFIGCSIQAGYSQQIDIIRPNGEIYKHIYRNNLVNLTYQQTPFLEVNYAGRVADITSDTLFVVVDRFGLVGLSMSRLVGLQRLNRGLTLAYSVGGVVVLSLVGFRLLRPVLMQQSAASSTFTSILLGGVSATGITLLSRFINPRRPRKRLDQGWSFRVVGAQ
jgi:hypothetical protein